MEKPDPKGLPPSEIVRRVKIALNKAGDTHTWEDVVKGLKAGAFQIFWNDHGCAITEIVQWPQKKTLHCWITAGELPGVMELQDQVIEHARVSGCSLMTTTARTGWARVLPGYGWKADAIVFTHKVPEHV